MGSNIFTKIGSLKVKNGIYRKDGVEKNRYHEIGVLMSSPHGSNLFLKMHATATSEPKLISVFMDEGVKVNVEKQEIEDVPVDTPDNIPTDEIPF